MFARNWNILLVDDEPDVLSVTKLALKNVTVYGIPLAIYTAKSKAEAIDLIKSELLLPNGVCIVAVAFIDVVMETDKAGLELCEFIRDEIGARNMQLYVRTGQPGVAPERAVIDRYDISGYFTKLETTEDKLYSLVKSGVRQGYTLITGEFFTELLHALATSVRTHAAIRDMLHSISSMVDVEGDIKQAVLVDGEGALLWNLDEAGAKGLRDRLERAPGIAMGTGGDKLVAEDNLFMVKIAASPVSSEVYVVGNGSAPAPEIELRMLHRFYQTLGQIWKSTT